MTCSSHDGCARRRAVATYRSVMPFTFFAHQVPVLPVARKWPQASDGVALVIGSMAPDFAYVLQGSRFAVWAHGFPGVVTFCVPATVVVSWLVVRVLAPVVPSHLPQLGDSRLRDYREVATHRFHVLGTPICAFLGALSHVALDHFTHEWGWFARHVDWYNQMLGHGPWLGRQWTPFRVVQYVGHIGGTTLCVYLMWCYGRQRWMTARAAEIDDRSTSASTVLLSSCVAIGLFAAVAWVRLQPAGSASDILRVAGGAFAGMTLGALAARLSLARDGRRAPARNR